MKPGARGKAKFSETGEGRTDTAERTERDNGPRDGSRKVPQLLTGKTGPKQI